jgi:hypothetical protein
MRALQKAQQVRRGRAQLKRRIAGGEVSVADVLLSPPTEAATWGLGEILTSQRRWGTARCRRFLRRAGIDERKPIGRLTERQRRVLVEQLTAERTFVEPR